MVRGHRTQEKYHPLTPFNFCKNLGKNCPEVSGMIFITADEADTRHKYHTEYIDLKIRIPRKVLVDAIREGIQKDLLF